MGWRVNRIGPYEVVERLGRGAFTVVYRARKADGGPEIALKVLDERDHEPKALERFMREAEIASHLSDIAIPSIHEIGTDGPHHYIAMDLVEGRALDAVLRETGPLDIEKVIDLGIQISRALSTAHAIGIVHRDIKPANLILTTDGKLRVLDFGLSRMAGMDTISASGTITGTAPYMSPEQLLGERVDARSDLFSASVVLYELIAGRRPFDGDRFETVAHAILNLPPVRLSTLGVAIADLLERVLFKGLAKNPDLRYQSAEEMRNDWELVREGSAEGLHPARLFATADVMQAAAPEEYAAFVGRDTAIDDIDHVLRVVGVSGGTAVMLSGEAGVGKTRFIEEFAARTRADGWETLTAQCSAGRGTRPYQAWADLLERYFTARGRVTPDSIRDALLAMGLDLRLAMLDLFFKFSASPTAMETDVRGLWEALAALVRRIAEDRPLLLQIDDIHRADEESLEFLQYLSGELRNAPVVVVGTYRQDELQDSAEGSMHPLDATIVELRRSDFLHEISLDCLDGAAVRELVASRFTGLAVGDAIAEQIHRKSEGNPLHVVETLKLLEAEGNVRRRNGEWVLSGDLTALPIPQKVADLIRNRLDGIPRDDRELLEFAAVAGENFAARIVTDGFEFSHRESLRRLRRLDQMHGIVRATERGYRFVQAKVRDFLLESLPPELTIEYHRSIARSLERLSGGRDDGASETAEHFLLGGEPMLAVPHLEAAGDRDYRLFANEQALKTWQQARKILTQQAPREEILARCRCLRKIAGVERRLGRYEESILSASLLLKLADDADAPSERAEAHLAMSLAQFHQGDSDRSLASARAAREGFANAGDEESVARALDQEGDTLFTSGSMDKALSLYTEALEVRKRWNSKVDIAQSHLRIGRCHRRMRAFEQSIDHLMRARETLEHVGDKVTAAVTGGEIANTYFMLQRFGEASPMYEASLDVLRRAGDRWRVARLLLSAGNVQFIRGNLTACRDLYEESLAIRREVGDRQGAGTVQNNLAWVHFHQARYADAISAAHDGHAAFTEFKDLSHLADTESLLGWIYLSLGDPATSGAHFARAAEIAAGQEDTRAGAVALAGGARAEAAAGGDIEATLRELSEGLDLSGAPDVGAEVAMARAACLNVSGRRDKALAAARDAMTFCETAQDKLLKTRVETTYLLLAPHGDPDVRLKALDRIADVLAIVSASHLREMEYGLRCAHALLLHESSPDHAISELRHALGVADMVLTNVPEEHRLGWCRVNDYPNVIERLTAWAGTVGDATAAAEAQWRLDAFRRYQAMRE